MFGHSHPAPPRPIARTLIVLALMMLGTGCADLGTGPAEITVPAGAYSRVFDATRAVLADARFDLERVDAAAGVISTRPKGTGGLATPWDFEQSTLGQEFEDALNLHVRRVRVTFEPPSPPEDVPRGQAATGPLIPDLRDAAGPLSARVEVIVSRLHRPLWQLEPSAVGLSGFASDPALRARGMQPTYDVPFTHDERLARRLADEIRQRAAVSRPGGEK